MRNWLNHLNLSPGCMAHPGIADAQGRFACPCGWVEDIPLPVLECYRQLPNLMNIDGFREIFLDALEMISVYCGDAYTVDDLARFFRASVEEVDNWIDGLTVPLFDIRRRMVSLFDQKLRNILYR